MKVLIWDKSCSLKEMGGPIGYMWNIKEYLKDNPCTEITFYSDIMGDVHPENTTPRSSLFRKTVTFFEKSSLIALLLFLYRMFYKSRILNTIDRQIVSGFDYVHFHIIQAYYPISKDSCLKGKSIITTHTPEPFIDELFKVYNANWILKYFPFIRKYLLKKEVNVYNRADYIMFPAKEAIEAYTNNIFFKNTLKNNKHKIFFVPTCVLDKKFPDYNEHDGKLRVCYIGRHNEIKGYDKLKDIARLAFSKNIDVEFNIGGKEGPLFRLEDANWKELGWINTIQVLSEMDAFILPNKDTYFDLIFLEVLRQGVPIIASNTGGNKFFRKYTNYQLYFYDYADIGTAVSIINHLSSEKKQGHLVQNRDSNRSLYLENFTMKNYVINYISELTKLHE